MSGSGGAQRPSLTFGCVGEARSDVVPCELWKIRQNLVLGHSAGQILQNIPDRNARAADTRLAEADGRIQGDVVEQIHFGSLPRFASVRPADHFPPGTVHPITK